MIIFVYLYVSSSVLVYIVVQVASASCPACIVCDSASSLNVGGLIVESDLKIATGIINECLVRFMRVCDGGLA